MQPPKQHTDASLVQHVVVNYDEIDATVKVLEDNDVETIISAITMEYEATSRAQLNLIEAAEKSKVTKRFIPSEYGIINSPEYGWTKSHSHKRSANPNWTDP